MRAFFVRHADGRSKGTFYVFTEGLNAPVKIAASLCLTHHPPNPPEESEIVRRAAESRRKLR